MKSEAQYGLSRLARRPRVTIDDAVNKKVMLILFTSDGLEAEEYKVKTIYAAIALLTPTAVCLSLPLSTTSSHKQATMASEKRLYAHYLESGLRQQVAQFCAAIHLPVLGYEGQMQRQQSGNQWARASVV